MGSERSFEDGSEQAQAEAAFAAAAHDVLSFFKEHKFDLKRLRGFFSEHPGAIANFIEEFRSDTFVGALNRAAMLDKITNSGSSSSSRLQREMLSEIFRFYSPEAAEPVNNNARKEEHPAKKIKLSGEKEKDYEAAVIQASIAQSAPANLDVSQTTGALHLQRFPSSNGMAVAAANNDGANNKIAPFLKGGSRT